MFRSSLFLKTFTTVTLGVIVMCATFYLTTVPMVNSMAFEMEEKAGRTILNDIYLLIEQSHADLQSMRRTALEGHKRELKHLIDLTFSFIKALQREVEQGALDGEEAKRLALERIRQFRYGEQDYVWVSDYQSRLISHPDPKLNGADFSQVKDIKGQLIVPPMVEGAIAHGEGYYTYWWRRLGAEEPIEKLSYYRNLPEWRWVVGTGVYIDDLKREVETRKRELIAELRKHIHKTKFAGEGYLYIFDSKMNMIIHPNSNIEGTNFARLLDPATGHPIGKELVQAAQTPEGKLTYRWDKPSDPGHYVYEKISWVRYFPGFDWYIALSAYTKDLERSAMALTRRIVLISLVALALALVSGYLFVRAFTTPIARMAAIADRISHGDLSTTIRLERRDEIGLLAQAFNNMVQQLRDQIRNLETRVAQRTKELSSRVQELKERNQQIETINAMGDLLQACRSPEEIHGIIIHTLQTLFPQSAGQILTLDRSSGTLEVVAAWRGTEQAPEGQVYGVDDCWCIRRGKPHIVADGQYAPTCRHAEDPQTSWPFALCFPLTAQGEIVGVLHVRLMTPGKEDDIRTIMRLIETVAEHATLALANLKLQRTLQEQSIRDPLTGLYNRRYAEEILRREERRALREGYSVGILLMDVDHFKRINDTWGHDAGDEVLRRLADVLRRTFREEDTICRYGGEEFLAILPGADLEKARYRAEQLREQVQGELHIPWQGQTIPVTISIGVACFPNGSQTIHQAIESADEALYRAKEEGRNCVRTLAEAA